MHDDEGGRIIMRTHETVDWNGQAHGRRCETMRRPMSGVGCLMTAIRATRWHLLPGMANDESVFYDNNDAVI